MEDPLPLLVRDQGEPMGTLKLALECQAIHTRQTGSCQAASDWLNGENPSQVVLTDEMLPDRIWADIVSTAAGAHEPVDLIVVAPSLDVRFYAETIQCGAFDCDGRHD